MRIRNNTYGLKTKEKNDGKKNFVPSQFEKLFHHLIIDNAVWFVNAMACNRSGVSKTN